MPKLRQTCTRCSQRRQKCDRKHPCTRCVQNKEAHLCTTTWSEGYNPSVHRRYPKKPSISGQQSIGPSGHSSNASPPGPLAAHIANGTSPAESSSSNLLNDPERFNIGESRVIDISIGTLLNEKDTPPSDNALFDQSFKYVQSNGKFRPDTGRTTSSYSPAAKAAELQYIQSILPNKEGLLRVVRYYEENMLYWCGGMYHGPSFRRQLHEAYGNSDTIDLERVDWRFMALLFAILASSLIGCPETISFSWGYSFEDKIQVSRSWGTAAVTCLNLGNFTSQYHMSSIHAIFVLHAYEHLVGSTTQWVALRSVAVVIARGLGLHRLGPHPDDARVSQLNDEERKAFIEREIGRRTWSTIASQEWLCAASQTGYIVTIQKRHFTTSRPMEVNEETMLPTTTNIPSVTVVGRYFYDYGSVLLDFYNATTEALDTDETQRYATILKFDGEMRVKCAETLPLCLQPHAPLDASWPKWVTWARTLHQASIDNKLIMLHQSFLNKSFRDPRYTYTRWACATSAKNIINAYKPRDPEEPQWWVEQAFVVTAAICLLLDMFHRPTTDPEASDYHTHVQKAIRWLQQFTTSSVALHGVKLLYSLLQEYNKLHGIDTSARPDMNGSINVPELQNGTVPQSSQGFNSQPDSGLPVAGEDNALFNFDFDIDNLAFEDLMDYIPTDNSSFFDSIFNLAGRPELL